MKNTRVRLLLSSACLLFTAAAFAQVGFPPPPPKVSPAAGVIDMHVPRTRTSSGVR